MEVLVEVLGGSGSGSVGGSFSGSFGGSFGGSGVVSVVIRVGGSVSACCHSWLAVFSPLVTLARPRQSGTESLGPARQ